MRSFAVSFVYFRWTLLELELTVCLLSPVAVAKSSWYLSRVSWERWKLLGLNPVFAMDWMILSPLGESVAISSNP